MPAEIGEIGFQSDPPAVVAQQRGPEFRQRAFGSGRRHILGQGRPTLRQFRCRQAMAIVLAITGEASSTMMAAGTIYSGNTSSSISRNSALNCLGEAPMPAKAATQATSTKSPPVSLQDWYC